LFGTYTWSHALDNAPEQNNIDSGAFYLSDPTNRRRDYGNSLTDRRNVFNANAVWTPSLNSHSKLPPSGELAGFRRIERRHVVFPDRLVTIQAA